MLENNHVSEENLKNFVGVEYEYYQQKWQLKIGQFAGFNMAAFFLTTAWLVYRKMYLLAVISSILIGLFFWIELFNPLPNGSGFAVNICIAVFFGIFGNTLYKVHVNKKIQQNKVETNPEALEAQLNKKGGTNLWLAHTFVFIVVVLVSFVAYFVSTIDLHK